MSSRTLTKRRDFLGIIIWEILPGLFVSETVAVLSPFILGYALYRWVVGGGVQFVPQSAFFLIAMVTAVAFAWGLASLIVAFLKLRHMVIRPIIRLIRAALYRMEHGSPEPFHLKTRIDELLNMVAIFNRFFNFQDQRVEELDDVVAAFGHDAGRFARHISNKVDLCLDPAIPEARRKQHLAELPEYAKREIHALFDHIDLNVGIVQNYNRIKGPPFADVDVVALANARLDELRGEADAKGIDLSAEMPSTCVVRAHEQKIAKIVVNLVDNAIKYTPDGGHVRLTVGWEKGNLVFAVSDTGCGIAAEYRDRVFDPSFRAPETSEIEGRGLGLSFVRSVARFYGGTCVCESTLGKGSTFTVALPLGAVGQSHKKGFMQ